MHFIFFYAIVIFYLTVTVAQLVEPRIVIPVVVGSSPISHPRILGPLVHTSGLFLLPTAYLPKSAQ